MVGHRDRTKESLNTMERLTDRDPEETLCKQQPSSMSRLLLINRQKLERYWGGGGAGLSNEGNMGKINTHAVSQTVP